MPAEARVPMLASVLPSAISKDVLSAELRQSGIDDQLTLVFLSVSLSALALDGLAGLVDLVLDVIHCG